MSAAQRVGRLVELAAMRGGHAVDLGADLVHRPLADAGVEQRLRRLRAVLLVQRDRGLELGQLLADEAVEAAERVALRRACRSATSSSRSRLNTPSTFGTAAL